MPLIENAPLLGIIILTCFCFIFLYRIYVTRNDGDYTIVNPKVTEDGKGRLDCSIDLLHMDNGRLVKDLKVSWKHQVLCANPVYFVRIKKGVLYLFKKGHPSYAQKEDWILLERKDVRQLQES